MSRLDESTGGFNNRNHIAAVVDHVRALWVVTVTDESRSVAWCATWTTETEACEHARRINEAAGWTGEKADGAK